jgi:hypothetical protein
MSNHKRENYALNFFCVNSSMPKSYNIMAFPVHHIYNLFEQLFFPPDITSPIILSFIDATVFSITWNYP